MAQISIQNLTFAYDDSNVFENVSLVLDTSWRLGFTGRNGRGKTTLLHLLMGRYEYSGSISAPVSFKYFPFEVSNSADITQNIFRETAPDAADWQIARELNLLNISEDVLDRPFSTLSGGEQTKVKLAALFLNDDAFLLIDEPTNHLDTAGRQIVSKYLNSKAGFILVSHDRTFLDNCVDHILSINRANIEVVKSNFSQWWESKERQDAYELAENARLKKDIKRLEKAAKQSSRWADKVESTKLGKGSAGIEKGINHRAYVGEKSRRMQQRRKNLERRRTGAIEEKSELLKNIDNADDLKITQERYHKTRLIYLRDVAVFYQTKQANSPISLEISAGDRIALMGPNGSGKSSILRLLCGENLHYTGELAIGSGLKISYVSQDTSGLSGSLTDYARTRDIDESLFKAILRKLDFSRIQFEKDLLAFSGGQKKKVLLAASLCERAHLLVWDEPLNFIDLLSRIQIENLLLKHKPTIIFVEHDALFTEKIATEFCRI